MNFVPDELKRILRDNPALERSYLVGGCVRDALLGRPNKDFDIEVFGISYDALVKALSAHGRTDLVGRSFGVVKLTPGRGRTYDFTVPRRDSKVAPGHRGFEIEFDPEISLEQAAARRDFTINALMYDPRQDRILDFHGGRADLEQRVLRHTSNAFGEDPLRVLRGMQFAGRFGLEAAPETLALCRSMKAGYGELAVERVREEWFKWAAKSSHPSAGLRFLLASGWAGHFPEIEALNTTPQDPEWHPEGNVFVHTCHCLDALVELEEWQTADEETRVVYSLAVLAHDFAKPETTHEAMRDGRLRIVSPGHEEAGGRVAESFLERIDAPEAVRRRVVPLVKNHLAHLNDITDRAVRRLSKRLEPENIAGLCVVITADHCGRPPNPKGVPEGVVALREKAAELNVQSNAPKPILMGRHLLSLGLKPGPQFGLITEQAYEAQLEGRIGSLNDAYAWLREGDWGFSREVLEALRQTLSDG